MKQAADISAELREISTTVAGIEKSNPFSVPHNYFAAFPEKILAVIRQPGADSMAAKDEIELASPLLASLKNKQPFTIPQHYFEEFKLPVAAVSQLGEAPVVTPVRSIFSGKKWIQYAAAAAVTGVIGWGVLMFAHNSTSIPGNDNMNQRDLAVNQDNQSDDGLQDLSDDDLNGYLADMPEESNTPDSAESAFFNLAVLNIDDKGLADLLHEIPDEDLQSFAEDSRDYLTL